MFQFAIFYINKENIQITMTFTNEMKKAHITCLVSQILLFVRKINNKEVIESSIYSRIKNELDDLMEGYIGLTENHFRGNPVIGVLDYFAEYQLENIVDTSEVIDIIKEKRRIFIDGGVENKYLPAPSPFASSQEDDDWWEL